MPSRWSISCSMAAKRASVSRLPSPASTTSRVREVSSRVMLPELPDAKMEILRPIVSPSVPSNEFQESWQSPEVASTKNADRKRLSRHRSAFRPLIRLGLDWQTEPGRSFGLVCKTAPRRDLDETSGDSHQCFTSTMPRQFHLNRPWNWPSANLRGLKPLAGEAGAIEGKSVERT